MEILSYDRETVTIQMNRKDEFLRLYKIVPAVVQEYEQLDEDIIGLTKEQVKEVGEAIRVIAGKLVAM